MKTQSNHNFTLFVFTLLLPTIAGANFLWIRHQQQQLALVRQKLVRAKQQQKAAQSQIERLQLALQTLHQEKARLEQPQYTLNPLLIVAIKNGDTKQALALVDAGADPNVKFSLEGQTAFMIACGQHREDASYSNESLCPEDEALLHAMLAHGADLHKSSKSQFTAFEGAVESNRVQTVELLLAHGAKVDVEAENGETPLILAARHGYASMARLLLAHGAHVNVTATEGYTPLMWGVLGDNRDVVRLLLAHGAKVNSQDDGGRSPLHFAVRYGRDRDIVCQLMAHGADAHQRRKDGMTAFDIALDIERECHYSDLVPLLSNYRKR